MAGDTCTCGTAQPIKGLNSFNVYDAGYGIGTVDSRSTIFQNLDAIDHALRHRVEVDEITEPALTDAVYPTVPVHQNENAIAAALATTEIAKIDRARAVGGSLRAVRIEADTC